jgi:hypothetical protein
VVFIWGVIAPRSQWRALFSWSASDAHSAEPGGTAYGWQRVLSGIGVVSLLTVVGVAILPGLLYSAQSVPGPTPIEQMWGSPQPQVINRTVTAVTSPPGGLVEVPVLGVQVFDEDDGPPDYLVELTEFVRLGTFEIPGLVGNDPEPGFSALDFADLVVNVRGALLCIPRQVLVVESETAVQIAVYYGLPDTGDGISPDNAVACPADSPVTSSVLIPLTLATPLGDRVIHGLDGTKLNLVSLP